MHGGLDMTADVSVKDRNESLDNVIYRLSKALSDGHKDLFEIGFSKFTQAYRDGLLNPKSPARPKFPALISLQVSAVLGFQDGRGEGGNKQIEAVRNRLDELVSLTALDVAPALKPVVVAFSQDSHELDSVMLELIKTRDEKALDIQKQTTRKFSGIFGDFAKRRSEAFCRNYFKGLEPSDVVDAIALSASKYRNVAFEVSSEEESRRMAGVAEKLVRVARELGGSNKPATMKLLSEVQTSLEEKPSIKLAM
jgi:hypothetical protein